MLTKPFRVSLIRRGHFNGAHKLHVPEWSMEKNYEVFGVCANPKYHGHNYEFEVKITGETDPHTGILIDLKLLSALLKEKVEDRLDHKNLNEEIPELAGINPTTENLCYLVWAYLRPEIDSRMDVHVRLWETPRNSAEYPATP